MNKSEELINIVESITSDNKEWGFFGTIKRNCDLGDSSVKEIWDYIVGLLTEKTGATENNVAKFLDSILGRHVADEILTYLEKKEDTKAAKEAIDTWLAKSSKWIIKKMKEYL